MTENSKGIFDPAGASWQDDRRILWRIVIYSLAFKILIAVILPLGVDETYATSVAREYSLSFFDHPPVSFWLPVIFADLTGVEHALIYRLPFLLAGVATIFVMYLIGKEIGGRRAGLWTAFFYATAPFFLLSAGVFVVPDGTLNLGSGIAALFLTKIAGAEGKAPLKFWIYAGLGLALALGSKYQAAWIPVAVLLYMLLTAKGRGWFLQPGPWIGGLIGLLGLAPVVIWNIEHDWASFGFHTARAGGGFRLSNVALMLFLQGLFLLPTGLYAAIAGFWPAIKNRQSGSFFMLALIAIGPIVVFNYVYLTSTGSFAHWSMPGWQFALPLAGAWMAKQATNRQRRFFVRTRGTLLVIWIPLLLLVFHANTGLLTRPFYDRPPDWDFTMSIFDYRDLQSELEDRGLWQETDVFMASSWSNGGILDTALKSQKPMRIFNQQNAHHFAFLSDATATGRALYMRASSLKNLENSASSTLRGARSLDPEAELLDPIKLQRGGQDYVYITIVRLRLK